MDRFGKSTMNCEQVQAIAFDLDCGAAAESAERATAIAHMAHCSRCAALQESWQAAREELNALGKETAAARAPERVETRLLQEFRARHRGLVTRRRAAVAAWALAAAAVLVGAISVKNWQNARHLQSNAQTPATLGAASGALGTGEEPADENLSAENSSAEDSAEFTPLPGTILDDSEEGAILRVRMQRGSLAALGLPVNEQRAADWIQVDLLVGNDGLPQGVRLAQEEN